MIYQMKQKLFSLGDDFSIRDEGGDEKFFVDGKVFALGHTLEFKDPAGNIVATVKKKLISLGAQYDVYEGDTLAATVKKHLFSLLRYRFTVDVPGPDDLEVSGDFLSHEYIFERGGNTVAEVSKRWLSLTDSYGVNVQSGEDDVLILAATVVIDMVLHDSQSSDD